MARADFRAGLLPGWPGPYELARDAGLWQLERVGTGGYASVLSTGNTQDNYPCQFVQSVSNTL